MDNNLELAIRAEYEQTDITLDALLRKYPLIEDTSGWEKKHKPSIPLDIIDDKPGRAILKQKEDTPAPEATKANIAEFKALAVQTALTTLREQNAYIEVKEFKDLVNIVDTVDKSYQKKDETPPVAVFMTNITNLIQEQVDDC